MAVYLYSVTPVDVFVVQYNVRRILAGDAAPSVQISVHPISAEGVLCLPPLTQCDDAIVRQGVCAYLAEALDLAEVREHTRSADRLDVVSDRRPARVAATTQPGRPAGGIPGCGQTQCRAAALPRVRLPVVLRPIRRL